jgi:hypothetical protein
VHAQKPAPQSVRLTIAADIGEAPNMADVALFLYDFDSLYEIARLAVDPQYKSHRFSRFSLYRNGRPLMATDRMLMRAISLQSPLEVVATVAVVGGAATSVAAAVWAIVQVIEKLYNLPLNRQKLELEVRKLKREEAQARLPLGLPEEVQDLERLLERRGAAPYLETVSRRLVASAVKVRSLAIAVVEELAPFSPPDPSPPETKDA